MSIKNQETEKRSLWPFTEMIDLSVPISTELPVSWPGHHGLEHNSWRSFDAGDSYQTNYVTMDEHCGTHCDAPAHFMRPKEYKGDWYFGEKVPLEQLHGPLACIDVRSLRSEVADGTSPEIGIESIAFWETLHRTLEPGDVVLFHTGWDKHLAAPKTRYRYAHGPVDGKSEPGWPVPSIAAIDYLVARGVRCFGIDTPSMGASQGGYDLHRYALSRSLVFIEGLANLDRIPAIGYHFMFLPLRLERSTGCPGRAIALGVQTS